MSSLQVLGAGFGRTGTDSLKLALQILYDAPCYHMREVLQKHHEHVYLWNDIAHGKTPQWEVLFKGYAAAVDFPAAGYWQEIYQAYPNVKVRRRQPPPPRCVGFCTLSLPWLRAEREPIERFLLVFLLYLQASPRPILSAQSIAISHTRISWLCFALPLTRVDHNASPSATLIARRWSSHTAPSRIGTPACRRPSIRPRLWCGSLAVALWLHELGDRCVVLV